ncbi:MAG: urate hydroxylase PuuD [Bacteriovoracaceae bacterium]
MNNDIFEWILLLVRWLHITVAVTWIGTSIFFMWLDRSFEVDPDAIKPGHVGEVWMVHGGGFYHVEKLLMGPTKVPKNLHWFKWESYWTWLSGFTLVCLIFYTGHGTFLLDSTVSNITYSKAVLLGLFSIFGSWFFYDFLWEREFTKKIPAIGHLLTMTWFAGMSFLLCKTFSGRAAYIHVGGMLGTWMTANVFMRIIPRQLKMVEASRRGEPVNQDWGKNAKNRSTHNTYFTLPVIFIMLSNHFPTTYGHEYNWLILLGISAGGAAIREYFVVRLSYPWRSKLYGAIGALIILVVMIASKQKVDEVTITQAPDVVAIEAPKQVTAQTPVIGKKEGATVKGNIFFEGTPPVGEKLNLPAACANQFKGDVYSNEVLVNNGKLANVLVRVTKGLEGKTYSDVPAYAVELDQRGCMYHPRVVATRVGQQVVFINSDPLFHNVKSVTEVNQKFNMAMPNKNQREIKVFMKAELFLQAKCSVHPWMGAYVAVMDHPYYFVTKENGEFEIQNLPIGNYTIEAWHESLGIQTKELKVTGPEPVSLDFIFKK